MDDRKRIKKVRRYYRKATKYLGKFPKDKRRRLGSCRRKQRAFAERSDRVVWVCRRRRRRFHLHTQLYILVHESPN